MEILISHGHPVDCRDAKGWPPLLYAHFVDHQDCVLALMRAKPAQVREGEGGGGGGRGRGGEEEGRGWVAHTSSLPPTCPYKGLTSRCDGGSHIGNRCTG